MLELVNKNGVSYFRSTVLKSKHGFSTRVGGFSALEHTKGLNLAFGKGDDDATVLKNVCTFAQALDIPAEKIISVPQIHSSNVIRVNDSHAGEGVYKKASFECDGYITDKSDLPIAVKTADCVPILMEARNTKGEVIAVCAVHAGWRGTAARITQKAIDGLLALGVKKENIFIAIGACIDECCYEVGVDFANEIEEKLGQSYKNKFIKAKENGSLYANLKGMNLALISERGIPCENVDVSEYCTCCDIELFYSHRGQKGKRGAMMSVICK